MESKKHILKRLTPKLPETKKANVVLFVIIFAVAGMVISFARAATNTGVGLSPQSGAITGNASLVTNNSAIGGKAVKFGSGAATSTKSGATGGSTSSSSLGRFGMALGGGYQSFTTAQLNSDFADMEAMGVQWVRFDIAWSDVQSGGSSSYNWAPYDAVVKAATQHNLKVLGILDYAPTWAQQASCAGQFACPPNGTSTFATYVAAAATHYGPLGVSAWEIWNEPNISTFWLKPSPSAYTVLLKAAYTAIKKVQPSATVISAGVAPAATDGTNYTQYDFIQGMYAAGAHGYFDALGDHPYCYSDPQCPVTTNNGGSWALMALAPQSLRTLMVANGDSNKKIWMTEFGAPTGGTPHVTEAQQAQMMQQAYTLAASYSWAGPLFWYTYQDSGTDQSTVEDWFGVLRADGSQKPSYTTYRQLTGK